MDEAKRLRRPLKILAARCQEHYSRRRARAEKQLLESAGVLVPPESDYQKLINWCQEKGAYISPKISIGYPTAGGKIRGLVVNEGCEIEPGEQIIDMPIYFSALSVKKETALGLSRGLELFAQQCQDILAPRSILNVFLVLSRRHPSRSSAELYVRTLPDEAADLPMFWTPEEINSLPKSIMNDMHLRLQCLEGQFPLCQRLLQLCCEDGSEPPLSRAEYEWAFCSVATRSLCRDGDRLLPEEKQARERAISEGLSGHEVLELMPVADMINYQSASGGTKVSNSTASVFIHSDAELCQWLAMRRLGAGDEITWEYSYDMTTQKLLRGYGFLPDLKYSTQAGDWTIFGNVNGIIRDQLKAVSPFCGEALTARKRAVLEAMGMMSPDGSPALKMVELAAGKEPRPIMSVARIVHALDEEEVRTVESSWAAYLATGKDKDVKTNVIGFLSKRNEIYARDFVVDFLKSFREVDLHLNRRPERVQEDLMYLTKLYNEVCSPADRKVPSDAVRLRRRRLTKAIFEHGADAYRRAIELCGGQA